MSLFIVIKTFLIFPVIFFERFFAPSTSVVSASSASVASTALHECHSFELRHLLHKYLAVLVKEVQSLLEVLGVSVVPGGEVILQFHLQVSMLVASLSQESLGKVALLGVLTCD